MAQGAANTVLTGQLECQVLFILLLLYQNLEEMSQCSTPLRAKYWFPTALMDLNSAYFQPVMGAHLPGVRPQGQGVHYEANLYFREKTSEFVISLLFCESLYWGCRSCLDYFSAPAIHFNMVLKTYSIVEWLFCQSRSFLERVVLYVVVVLMFPWEEMGSGSFLLKWSSVIAIGWQEIVEPLFLSIQYVSGIMPDLKGMQKWIRHALSSRNFIFHGIQTQQIAVLGVHM